ncbi:MAG: hypothetical protein ACON5B_04050 [Myxococcota bacterium]
MRIGLLACSAGLWCGCTGAAPDTDAADTMDGVDTTDTVDTMDTVDTTDSGDTADTGLQVDTAVLPETAETGLPIDSGMMDSGGLDSGGAVRPDTACGLLDSGCVTVPVDTGPPPPPDLYDIRAGLVPLGQMVLLDEVVVMAVLSDGAIVQDPMGGANSGAYLELGPGGASTLYQNQRLEVYGAVQEAPVGQGTRTTIDVTAAGGYVLQVGNKIGPDPVTLTLAELADPTIAEDHESVLVRVVSPRVWDGYDDLGATGDFTVGSAGQQQRVTAIDYFVGQTAYGDEFDSLTGVLWALDEGFAVGPRTVADVVNHAIHAAPANSLVPGDVVVTEIMLEPNTGLGGASCAAGTSSSGVYLELAANTTSTIDLDGLIVYDFGGVAQAQLRQSLLVGPSQRTVLFMGTGPNCYGFSADAVLDWGAGGAGSWWGLFSNTALLDNLNTQGWPVTPGVAWELSESAIDATSNDDVANWCEAVLPVVAGAADLGSPGVLNTCP